MRPWIPAVFKKLQRKPAHRNIDGKWLSVQRGIVPQHAQVPISPSCGKAHPVLGLTYVGVNRTDLAAEYLPLDCRI